MVGNYSTRAEIMYLNLIKWFSFNFQTPKLNNREKLSEIGLKMEKISIYTARGFLHRVRVTF